MAGILRIECVRMSANTARRSAHATILTRCGGYDLEEAERAKQQCGGGNAAHHRAHDAQTARVRAREVEIANRRRGRQPRLAIAFGRSRITVNRSFIVPGEMLHREGRRELLVRHQTAESWMMPFYQSEQRFGDFALEFLICQRTPPPWLIPELL